MLEEKCLGMNNGKAFLFWCRRFASRKESMRWEIPRKLALCHVVATLFLSSSLIGLTVPSVNIRVNLRVVKAFHVRGKLTTASFTGLGWVGGRFINHNRNNLYHKLKAIKVKLWKSYDAQLLFARSALRDFHQRHYANKVLTLCIY